MISFLKLIFLFILATIAHWAFATFFSFWGINVNLMLAFSVAFCAVLKPSFGYPTAFLCGLFLDFFGTKLFGNNAFTFSLIACAVYTLAERFDFEAFIPQILSVFGLTLFAGICNALLLYWFTASAMWSGFWNWFLGALTGGLFAPAIFWLVRKVLGNGGVCRN